MLPPFEIVSRIRPVDLLCPDPPRIQTSTEGLHPMPSLAPYVAATTGVRPESHADSHLSTQPDTQLAFHLGGMRLAAKLHDGLVSLATTRERSTTMHRSRRHGRSQEPSALGLSLTGTHLTAWVCEADRWVARAWYDLREDLDTRDEQALQDLQLEAYGGHVTEASGFGQLGLRDTRLITHADGSAWGEPGELWLTATAAGPGFFDTAHTSVWRLDLTSLEVERTGSLFFRRPDRPGAFGDHATHVVRDGDDWLIATSTWGDFEKPATRAARRAPTPLRITLAETRADVLRGEHLLATRELRMPTGTLTSVATWDPHLVRRDGTWWVGFVTARRIFDFHPALAAGPSLAELTLRGVAGERTATEGTTLVEVDGRLQVLASDGRDGRRGQRAAFPVFDDSMRQVGALTAPYPTNLPWPTVARHEDHWVMVTFNGSRAGGDLLGYGTHGDLVVMRSAPGSAQG